MVDSRYFNSPATQQPSAPVGTVAPPPVAQAQAPMPGPGQPIQPGQPAPQNQQPVAPQAPQVDYQSQIAAREAELHRVQAHNQQLQSVVGQIQRAAEENQQTQAFQQETAMMLAHADNLPADQARTYLQTQMQQVAQRERIRAGQEVQRVQQQADMEKKQIAAPL